MNHKISILTPFKNTANFLEECVLSVLEQTYTNWELLMTNDHSTDESLQIAKRFALTDDRIIILENNGTGIIPALRTAYNKASGTLITRMDSDDIMVNNKLEDMHRQLINFGNGHIALGLVKYFSNKQINDGYYRYQQWLNKLTSRGENFSEIYKECVIPSPCWMVFKEDLDRCDGFNPNTYPEDYDLTFRFYKHGLKCIPSSNLLHYWRDYPSRTSRTHIHYAQNYFLDIKMDYFLELDYDSSRPLTIWGAGYKGKHLAKILKDRRIPFNWICNNPKKIDKHIYGIKLHSFEKLKELINPQCVVTVANSNSQKEIRTYFAKHSLKAMEDYFFFC